MPGTVSDLTLFQLQAFELLLQINLKEKEQLQQYLNNLTKIYQ